MAMLRPTEVTPMRIKAIMPNDFKSMPYSKPVNGEIRTIVKVCYNIYTAKKDGIVLTRKDGSELTNVTAYVGFDDGSYFTFKNEVAIGQLMSITGEIATNEPSAISFDVEPCKVKLVETTITMGKDKKSFPSWVFEPID